MLRKQIAANRRAAASISAERVSLALAVTTRQLAGRIEEQASLLVPFDRAAAVRLCRAVEETQGLVRAESGTLENLAKMEGEPK